MQHKSIVQTGLVISYFGNSVAVETEDGQVFQCHLKRNQPLAVVGDKVEWKMETGDTGSIISILPRKTLLGRETGHGKVKPIAANIDVIVVVMAPPPVFSDYIINRYLIAAELLHIEPVIILNKSDLLDEKSKNGVFERLLPYQSIPYAVFFTSIYERESLLTLSEYLAFKNAVLVGPSGVGKSSIIAELTDNYEIRVGDVTSKGSGKHTTTATRLYHLPNHSNLIDSPGVRDFNLWRVNPNEILNGFKEFLPFLTGCKFRDCSHAVEPGCALQAAVSAGKISEIRYNIFQQLLNEAKK